MLVWTSLIAGQKRRAAISLLGRLFLALLVFQLANFHGWTWPWILGFAIPAAILIRSIGATAWFFSRHPFVSVDVGFSESAVPGGAVRCAVRMKARLPVRPDGLSFRLTAESRGGSTPTKELARVERTLDLPPLEPGERFEAEVGIPVPEDARFSYRSFEGRVIWAVETRLSIEGHLPFETGIEVLVAPPLGD